MQSGQTIRPNDSLSRCASPAANKPMAATTILLLTVAFTAYTQPWLTGRSSSYLIGAGSLLAAYLLAEVLDRRSNEHDDDDDDAADEYIPSTLLCDHSHS